MDSESDGLSRVHSLVFIKSLKHTGMKGLQVTDGTSVEGQVRGVEGTEGTANFSRHSFPSTDNRSVELATK